MRRLLVRMVSIFALLGFDFKTFLTFLREFPSYLMDYREIRQQHKRNPQFPNITAVPVLGEKKIESGTSSGAYFHQDLLIARRIFYANPVRHVDIGSRIDGFVAHVAVFREIEVFDIRPQHSTVRNIKFLQYDMTTLPKDMESYCDSVSSLHAIEHFGLGRYGDLINYEGHLRAIEAIHKLLSMNGKFYFSVPIGTQRIEFNAHRVFNLRYLLEIIENRFVVDSFSFVDDEGQLTEDTHLDAVSINRNFGCKLGCGIFELTRI